MTHLFDEPDHQHGDQAAGDRRRPLAFLGM